MTVYELTLAGANQFTGVDAATGLIDFTAYYNIGVQPNLAPVLLGYYYYQAAAAPANFTINVEVFRGAATSIMVLHATTARANLFRACTPPGLVIPRTATQMWQMRCVTTNKANDGTFCAWFGYSPVP